MTSNLVTHAERELTLLGYDENEDPDSMDFIMRRHILDIVQTFADAGHSGSSAFYAADVINKLLRYERLVPLTDSPEEWYYHGADMSGRPEGFWQSIRQSNCFSEDGGKTYYTLGEQYWWVFPFRWLPTKAHRWVWSKKRLIYPMHKSALSHA